MLALGKRIKMNTEKITDGEIADKKVASLPTRPNAPAALGGVGYTATEMKEAFDKLPLLIIERLNSLIDDINEGEISDSLKTGISEEHTLSDMLLDIRNGNFINYLSVFDSTLDLYLLKLREDIDAIAERIGVRLE